MKDLLSIAKILRPHGIKGAVKVSPNFDDIPFSYFKHVYLGNSRIDANITKVMPLNGFYSVMIDKISSCEEAEKYRNQYIYVDRNEYDAFDGRLLLEDMIGLEVQTEEGKMLGVVVEAENYGANDILTINLNGTSFMVPRVDEIIKYDSEKNIFVANEKRFLETRV